MGQHAILLLGLLGLGSIHTQQKRTQRIVFFGDSITELGAQSGGYVIVIGYALKEKNSGAEVIGAGVSGNKVPDLLARLDRDVLSHKPTTVFVYIGINDVW